LAIERCGDAGLCRSPVSAPRNIDVLHILDLILLIALDPDGHEPESRIDGLPLFLRQITAETQFRTAVFAPLAQKAFVYGDSTRIKEKLGRALAYKGSPAAR